MRAALIALLLSIATQAGAECGKLCYWRWWDSATTADLEAELDAGADVMALDDDGFTPLHWAANRGNSQHIQILVDAGAEVMGRDKRDGTPLHRAACCGGTENIKVLLAAGADIMARAKGGWTPLHSAARGGSLLSIITLLEAGADVNDWARKGGLTPLLMAVYHRRPEVVKAFLEAGAEVMAVQSEFGETPLHIAASCSYLCNSEVILLLMNAGADAKAKDVEGKSPWDLARKNEYLKDTDGYWALNDAQYR